MYRFSAFFSVQTVRLARTGLKLTGASKALALAKKSLREMRAARWDDAAGNRFMPLIRWCFWVGHVPSV